jgi:hypothetical protein
MSILEQRAAFCDVPVVDPYYCFEKQSISVHIFKYPISKSNDQINSGLLENLWVKTA